MGRSGWLVLGEEEALAIQLDLAGRWESKCRRGWGAAGLDALEIALRCAGASVGSCVITTPLTAFATTLAIIRAGAEPVWCDVDESGGLDISIRSRQTI